MDTLIDVGGGAAAYVVVALAVLIVAIAFDVLDPAKRKARRYRRHALKIAARRRPGGLGDDDRDVAAWLDFPDYPKDGNR